MSCCSKMFPDDNLTLQRIDYNGNELRLNGYYYCYFENTDITVIHFLFRNGIIRNAGGYSRFFENNREQEMLSYYNKSTKTDWGVFVVDGNKIQLEQWIEAPSGVRLTVNRRSGYIENDSTIHLTESYNFATKETRQINELWNFREFSPKPDSTNVFIK